MTGKIETRNRVAKAGPVEWVSDKIIVSLDLPSPFWSVLLAEKDIDTMAFAVWPELQWSFIVCVCG